MDEIRNIFDKIGKDAHFFGIAATDEGDMCVGYGSEEEIPVLIAAFLSTEDGRNAFADAIAILAQNYKSMNPGLVIQDAWVSFLKDELGIVMSRRVEDPTRPCKGCVFFQEVEYGFGKCRVLNKNIDGTEENRKNSNCDGGCRHFAEGCNSENDSIESGETEGRKTDS